MKLNQEDVLVGTNEFVFRFVPERHNTVEHQRRRPTEQINPAQQLFELTANDRRRPFAVFQRRKHVLLPTVFSFSADYAVDLDQSLRESLLVSDDIHTPHVLGSNACTLPTP